MAKADDIEADPGDAPAACLPAETPRQPRAVTYLDLWERHLVLCALHGLGPAPRVGRNGA